MNSSFLLKNILLINPAVSSTESRADITIIDGRISKIVDTTGGATTGSASASPARNEEAMPASAASLNCRVIDAHELWLTPGLIDMHTHLRDFAHSDKETIASGTQAAAAGGFTTVLAMANCQPPLDSVPLLTVLLKKIEENACIEVLPACCVTRGMQGAELTDMVELASVGAAAFSDDGKPIMNLEVLRRALEYSKLTGKVIISHAEDSNLSGDGMVHKSAAAVRLGLPMIPGAAESAAIAREIEIARETGQRLHFAHVSTARAVQLIRAAQADGVRVTGDVTPHHLTLTVDDIANNCGGNDAGESSLRRHDGGTRTSHNVPYNTSFKMNPPLRNKDDIAALVEGIADGTLSAIATDHAPHTRHEKQACFDCAPLGVTGLETAVPLTLAALVHGGKISPVQYIELLTTAPAKILGIIPMPALQTGCGTFAIIDPQHKWTYKASEGYSRSSNSPFDGRELTGKAVMTVYQGSVVYQDRDHQLSAQLDLAKLHCTERASGSRRANQRA